MDPDLQGTIWQHEKIIRHSGKGYCWWAWWKSKSAGDALLRHKDRFRELSSGGPFQMGLFSRSLLRAYVATVDEVRVGDGQPIASPELDATPEYYNLTPWPAWFRITDIQRIDRQPITPDSEVLPEVVPDQITLLESRFRKLRNNDWTVHWLEDQYDGRLEVVEVEKSRLLHISDLHLGPSHVWQTASRKTASGITLQKAIEVTLQQHDIEPRSVGLIVASGDISDHGPRAGNYRNAHAFFRELMELTATDPTKLVIVPGNHDVTRHMVDDTSDIHDNTSNEYNSRQQEGEKDYRKFVERLFGVEFAITALRPYSLPENRINILQLDSTLPRDQYTKEYGFVGSEPLLLLHESRQLHTPRMDGDLSIMVLHHHPLSTVSREYVPKPGDIGEHADPVSMMVDQSAIIDMISQYEIRLVLHGHQHCLKHRVIASRSSSPRPGSPFFGDIVSAGSAGCSWRPEMEHLSMNVIDFSRHEMRLRSFALVEDLSWTKPLRDVTLPVAGHLQLEVAR